ncbi:Cytochrome P450 87A3 [Linum perenne]
MYKYLKNMVLNLFGPESLKKMIPEIEQTTSNRLKQWSLQDSVEMKEATATTIFDLTAKKLISYDQDKSSENLRENFVAFIQGLISFPLNIPGTAYNKCLKGRKRAMKMLKNLLHERRISPKKHQSDFFDHVLEELHRDNTILTEEIALDLMFVLLFASFETTSLALTLAMKFLSDHPRVLKQLTEEHEAILKNRKDADSGLTWKEYKSMTFTFQFINETVRLANIVPGIFRKVLRDIQFKGYTIPAGWAVMVCPPAVHLNPAKYEDPLAFNPWRWEGQEINGASRNFMAFGGGMRFCVGTEFTKVQMAVFLHCLVTKYRWKPIKGGNIIRTPGLQFPQGYHVQILERDA